MSRYRSPAYLNTGMSTIQLLCPPFYRLSSNNKMLLPLLPSPVPHHRTFLPEDHNQKKQVFLLCLSPCSTRLHFRGQIALTLPSAMSVDSSTAGGGHPAVLFGVYNFQPLSEP